MCILMRLYTHENTCQMKNSVYQNLMDVTILYTQACIIMIKCIDFGMGILLKVLLGFLNNKHFVLNF